MGLEISCSLETKSGGRVCGEENQHNLSWQLP
jgi:hypothetical protein